MRTLWALAFGVMFGLLAAGALLLTTRPPEGEAIRLLPPPTPSPLVVQVSGAVMHPGLYKLAQGSRVQDAIQAAGGLAEGADDQGLNLAALVKDGDRLRVPYKPAEPAAGAGPPVRNGPLELPAGAAAPGLIDINTASLQELDSLPGIGPVTAQKIVDHRQVEGPFTSIEAIQDVSGIGPATFEKIKDLITVGN